MSKKINALLAQMQQLEVEVQEEFEKKNQEIRRKFARLDEEIQRKHKSVKIGVLRYVSQAKILVILTAPIIYSLIIAFALLDLMVSIYQAICFRIYGIPLVRRKNYFSYDRSQLKYLNTIEKLNCAYCSYGTGVIAYAQEIASLTEKYWCPIKHAERLYGKHKHYSLFEEYGDAKNYRSNLNKHRAALKDIDETNGEAQ